MKVYEHEFVGDMNYSYSLRLEDDGRFSYIEAFVDPAGAGAFSVSGTWRRDGDTIVLLPLEVPWSGGGWEYRQGRRAVERGDAIDLGGGLELRAAPDREREEVVRNVTAHPITVRVGETGARHLLAPGERVRVVARGPAGLGAFHVERGEHEVVVWGWQGARISVVPIAPEPPQANPPAPRPARVEAPEPAATPARRPVPTPGPPPPRWPPEDPRFAAPGADAGPPAAPPPAAAPAEPGAGAARVAGVPSPELAARLRQRVDEFRAKELPLAYIFLGRAKDFGAIPLWWDQFNLYALRPSGEVLWIDNDNDKLFGAAEPVTDRDLAYRMLASGAGAYPEVAELIPADAGVRTCEQCGGRRWTLSAPGATDTVVCSLCAGEGWLAADAP